MAGPQGQQVVRVAERPILDAEDARSASVPCGSRECALRGARRNQPFWMRLGERPRRSCRRVLPPFAPVRGNCVRSALPLRMSSGSIQGGSRENPVARSVSSKRSGGSPDFPPPLASAMSRRRARQVVVAGARPHASPPRAVSTSGDAAARRRWLTGGARLARSRPAARRGGKSGRRPCGHHVETGGLPTAWRGAAGVSGGVTGPPPAQARLPCFPPRGAVLSAVRMLAASRVRRSSRLSRPM